VSVAQRLALRRLAALIALPAALLIAWSIAIWPLWYMYESQQTWRVSIARTLAHQRALLQIEPTVRAHLAELPNAVAWQRLYSAKLDSAGVIALQTDLGHALAAAHVRPQSFAPIATTRTGTLRKIGLRVVASMTIDELRELFRQTALLSHLVRLENLLITAPAVQSRQENPRLVVTMDAFGFAREEHE
jgi:hypothetical protein